MSTDQLQAPADGRYAYDVVPYDGYSFPQSHVDRLATLATLFGARPTPTRECRVLELGSGVGSNLVPMAVSRPHSQFVGIDLSARQVAASQDMVRALGLTNIEFKHGDLADLGEDVGRFDYVIAHGVYSWVSDLVQEKLLEICRRHTTPQGVSYVSYNTYPGWHFRGLIRDMMQYHTAPLADPAARAQQARALLDFLAQSVQAGSAYGLMLKDEIDTLRKSSDAYLLHDHLAELNTPLYFHQFVERAARHGLQYLAEAEFSTMLASNFPPEVADTLRRISTDLVRTEQYMDFVRNRAFRQTLLCWDSVPLNRNLTWQDITGFRVASAARPQAPALDVTKPGPEVFALPAGGTIGSPHAVVKAAFQYLGEIWPRSVPFDDLVKVAAQRCGQPEQAALLGGDLLTAYSVNAVVFRLDEPDLVSVASERPVVSPLARYQAQAIGRVNNQVHETVNIDVLGRHVLPLLDGSRNKAEVVAELVRLVQTGALSANQAGRPITSPEELTYFFDNAVGQAFTSLARAALFMA